MTDINLLSALGVATVAMMAAIIQPLIS